MSGSRRVADSLDAAVAYAVLIISVLAIVFPLVWIVLTSLKSQVDILTRPLALLPTEFALAANFEEIFRRAPWLVYFRNTVVVVVSLLLLQFTVAIPAAYAFATFRFRGRGLLFIVVLTRLMISPDSVILPNYITILNLGLMDTLVAIFLPFVGSAIAILIFRQALLQIPHELRESAIVDGCGDLGYILRIALPLMKPSLVAFGIISSVYQWNAFFWPMLVTESVYTRTLPVGLAQFGLRAETGAEWGLTMTATLLVIGPILLAFLVFQRQFLNSFARSGLK